MSENISWYSLWLTNWECHIIVILLDYCIEFRKSKECMGRAILQRSEIFIALALILAGASGNYLRMDKSGVFQEYSGNISKFYLKCK